MKEAKVEVNDLVRCLLLGFSFIIVDLLTLAVGFHQLSIAEIIMEDVGYKIISTYNTDFVIPIFVGALLLGVGVTFLLLA